MRDSENYSVHADRCKQEASDAVLDNVRDRALRAEAAWRAMATRSARTEASRAAREARPLAEAAPAVFSPSPLAE